MEENQEAQISQEELKQYKFSVELKQSAKKENYIGSIKVRADTIEELEINLKKAKELVLKEWG